MGWLGWGLGRGGERKKWRVVCMAYIHRGEDSGVRCGRAVAWRAPFLACGTDPHLRLLALSKVFEHGIVVCLGILEGLQPCVLRRTQRPLSPSFSRSSSVALAAALPLALATCCRASLQNVVVILARRRLYKANETAR